MSDSDGCGVELKSGSAEHQFGSIPHDWSICRLQALVDKPIAYGVLKPGDHVPNGLPLLQIRDVIHGDIDLDGLHRIGPLLDSQYARTRLAGGELVISLVGTIGKIAHIPQALASGNVHRNLGRISVAKQCDAKFLYYFLTSDRAQSAIKLTTFGSTQALLNLGDLRRLEIAVPLPPEQRAIAAALSDVDALIGALDRLIAKKRDLKQATMQQLLTGQTRLPGFAGKWVGKGTQVGTTPQDWRAEPIGPLVQISSGESPSGFQFSGDGIPYFKVDQLNRVQIGPCHAAAFTSGRG